MSTKIDISNERKLTQEESSELLAAFASDRPETFASWVKLEKRGSGVGPIWEDIIDFLRSSCRYKSRTDLDTAAFSLRGDVYEIATRPEGGAK